MANRNPLVVPAKKLGQFHCCKVAVQVLSVHLFVDLAENRDSFGPGSGSGEPLTLQRILRFFYPRLQKADLWMAERGTNITFPARGSVA